MKPSACLLVCIAAVAMSSCSNRNDQAFAQSGNATDTIGVASVIDGDTIEIHGQRIRLSGFDTPERGKRCGKTNMHQQAAFALSNFIGGQTVHCDSDERDRYGRVVATCTAGGVDLGKFMVREGFGRDWPKYSGGKYASEERSARRLSKGVWSPTCDANLWGSRVY